VITVTLQAALRLFLVFREMRRRLPFMDSTAGVIPNTVEI